jgi:1,2-diacylglycerol 3-beta-galactosyltransferase
VLTDLADYPPNFWIERESEYIVCGSERARRQALAMGHSTDRIFKTSGMVLKPSFYRKPKIDREQEKIKLGLKPGLPTGIVMSGGHGSASMLEIAKQLNQNATPLQMIFLCGHNLELAAKLRNLRLNMPVVIEEFTTQVDYFLSLADFFVGKAGPGSISEALQFGLPVIVERNARTMPQERYNATWLAEQKLGIVVPDFDKIGPIVEQLLSSPALRELRDNVTRYENHAVFEVPLILDRVMAGRPVESWRTSSTLPSVAPFGSVAWAGLT